MRTISVNHVMTNGQAPVIMYARFYIVLPLVTLFQYSWFHIIFVLGAMYVAMLLTDWYEYMHRISVSALIGSTTYAGMSSARARHHPHPRPRVKTFISGVRKRRCGCVSSVRGSACSFIYGACSLRSTCPTGTFIITWLLVKTCAHVGRSFLEF